MSVPTPRLERRDGAALEEALRARMPAYLPELAGPPGERARALLAVHGRLLAVLAERVNAAPAKSELAFLDMLGVDLLPAQGARAAVAFAPVPGAWDGHAPRGTRLQARGAEGQELVFETERAVALPGARLAEVVAVWPGRDAYADHTAGVVGGHPLTLWEPLAPIAHELYVRHDPLLALSGRAVVELEVAIDEAAGEPLEVEWTYWDGEAWAPFVPLGDSDAPSFDGTLGLRRSGRVRLTSECAGAQPTRVGGIDGHWLRGRLRDPLPPGRGRRLPSISGIGLRSVVERPVSLANGACAGGVAASAAYADGAALDTTKLFHPLGMQAGPESAFFVSCEEAFGRPGARVTLCLQRATTAQDTADARLAPYEAGVNAAQLQLTGVKIAAAGLLASLRALVEGPTAPLRADQPINDSDVVEAWYADVRDRARDALTAARDAAGPAQVIVAAAGLQGSVVTALIANFLNPIGLAVLAPGATLTLATTAGAIILSGARVVVAIAEVADRLSANPPQARRDELDVLRAAIARLEPVADALIAMDPVGVAAGAVNLVDPPDALGAIPNLASALSSLVTAWSVVAANLQNWPAAVFLPAGLPGFIGDARANITAARNAVLGAIPVAEGLIAGLEDLSPITLAAAAGVLPPELDSPTMAWEYWNGTAWTAMPGLQGAADVRDLLASGTLSFDAPEDWEPSAVATTRSRWLRARILSGSFARVRLVSWTDSQTKELKFMAVVEPRPPALDALRIGYRWEPPPAAPQSCLTHNDFAWSDETEAAAARGASFVPFRPTEDRTPALYLGFDGPLPADLLGVLLDVEEGSAPAGGPALEWECWDGQVWRRLGVEDETDGLTLPGIAFIPWPGVAAPAASPVAEASGTAIRLLDRRTAARFAPGQEVYVALGDEGELAGVAEVEADTLRLRGPLASSYRGGAVAPAGLARFGRPRTWMRLRMREDGEPPRATVRGIHPNAVWARHSETLEREVLGGSDGRPGQVMFTARRPVLPGQLVEVRELDGPRADTEYRSLVAELAAAGVREEDLGVVRDAQGAVREVWVPWRERASLMFAEAGERLYAIDRERGRIIFGDDRRGRVPPAGPDSVRMRHYRVGGGEAGNVSAGAISSVVSGVLAEGVTNPRRAEGGADSEPGAAALERGPLVVRHRLQALTTGDYEALARQASPEVAVARARGGLGPGGLSGPGHVTVVIVPRGDEAEPLPSLGLRRRVAEFLAARAPAGLASPPAVVAPVYERIGVVATLAPRAGHDARAAASAAEAAVARFLHPLSGGPSGRGWGFGRDVHLSDLAGLLDGLDEVELVLDLQLTSAGVPQGDAVAVPGERLVSAGEIRIGLVGGAG